jgi:hypothetical protein
MTKKRANTKQTVTITAPRGSTRVKAGGNTYPVGEPIEVTDETITALQEIRGVTVDVAGEPDADTPQPTTEE